MVTSGPSVCSGAVGSGDASRKLVGDGVERTATLITLLG
jgi:hypothetical protein